MRKLTKKKKRKTQKGSLEDSIKKKKGIKKPRIWSHIGFLFLGCWEGIERILSKLYLSFYYHLRGYIDVIVKIEITNILNIKFSCTYMPKKNILYQYLHLI